ncbi:MAG: DUF4350 domain-containing protein [Bacteroidota bacterium]
MSIRGIKCLCLAALLVLCIDPLTAQTRADSKIPLAAAASSVTLTIPDTSVLQLTTFDLPIFVSDISSPGIISAQWTFNYNPNSLDVIDVWTGTVTQWWGSPTVNYGTGTISVAMAGSDTLAGNGVFAYIRLKVKRHAVEPSMLELSDVMFNEDIFPTVTNGTLTPLPGPTITIFPSDSILVRKDSVQYFATGGVPPFRWFTSDTSVAAVDSVTGILKAKKGGQIVLSAFDTDGFDGTLAVSVFDFNASIPHVPLFVGDSVDVPIVISDVTGLGILSKEITIQYDTSRVRFAGIDTAGTLSAGMGFAVKDSGLIVRMAFAGTLPLSGSGDFVKMRFRHQAPAGPGQFSPLTFIKYENNEPAPGQPKTLTTNGSITIQSLPNSPPVFTRTMGDTTVNENQALAFNFDAADPDNDPLKFSLQNHPPNMSIDSVTGNLYWVPNYSQAGVYVITVIVSDGKGGTASKVSSINVLNVNQKPVITSFLPIVSIGVGNLFTFQFTATDPENDSLNWSAFGLPPGATFTTGGFLQWRPVFTQINQNYNVTFYVGDGINTVSHATTLTAFSDNHPPVFSKLFTDTTIAEGQQLSFLFTTTDVDGDIIVYSLQNPSTGMTISSSTGLFNWMPAFTQSGIHSVSVIANDQRGMTTAANLTITVSDVNRPPVFTSVPPDTVIGVTGPQLSIQYTAVDADNDVPVFSFADAPIGAVITQNGLFTWTPTETQTGVHRVIVRVSDEKVFVSDTSFIRVVIGNTPPRFTAVLSDTTINEDQELLFTFEATDDENNTLQFFLPLPSVAGVTITPAGVLQWRPDFTQAGIYTIAVSVTDGMFFVTDSARVTVVNVNRPPQFVVSLPDFSTWADTAISFHYAAEDPDNDSLLFSVAHAPASAVISTDGSFSWIPSANDLGIDTIIIAVHDGTVSVFDTALITVVGLAIAEISEQNFDFGSITFGGTKKLFAGVINNGIVPLILSMPAEHNAAGDPNFALDTAGVMIIPPGEERTIGITYTPTSVGGHFTHFVFMTNDLLKQFFVLTANGSAIAKLAVTRRILIDTLHRSTIPFADSTSGADELFTFLKQSGMQISFTGSVFSPSGHDVMLTLSPQSLYQRAEIDSIRRFVEQGGVLIGIGNAAQEGSNDGLNSLLTDTSWTTGLALNNDLVIDSVHNYFDPVFPLLTAFADTNHPFLTGVDTLVFFASASVRISGGAIPLVTTSPEGRIAGATAASQPAVVGLNSVGKGKIIVIGDLDAWSPDSRNETEFPPISVKDNLAFLINILSVSEDYEVKLPGKTPSEEYRLVSVPFDLENSEIAEVLKDLGGINPLIWRLFGRYDPQSGVYAEFPSERFKTFARGEAYWLITRGEFDITFGSTTVVPVQSFYPITIGPGYSMIGNPFPYKVSWQHSIHDSVETRIWKYDGTSFKAESLALEPFSGYFVKNLTTDTITIYINPDDITASSLSKSFAAAYGENEWRIGVSARAGKSADEDNFAGVSPNAQEEYDRYDLEEPPTTPTDYVMVRFNNTAWKERPGSYAMDIRPVNEEGLFWDFDVTTAKAQTRVTLTFSHLGNLPAGFDYYIIDKRTERAIPITASSVYEFTMFKNESRRNFRLIAGNGSFIEQNTEGIPLVPPDYALMQNYPNPFNPVTQIRYSIGNSGHVALNIYNVLGQRVRTLHNAFQSIGTYSAEWDGKDDRGITASTGVYFYTITVTANNENIFTSAKKMILMK